jgi:hypothetical protein
MNLVSRRGKILSGIAPGSRPGGPSTPHPPILLPGHTRKYNVNLFIPSTATYFRGGTMDIETRLESLEKKLRLHKRRGKRRYGPGSK